MEKEELVLSFFDLEKPCPEKIASCQDLRSKYANELKTLSKSGCSSCKRNALKSKYINIIWENYVVNSHNIS